MWNSGTRTEFDTTYGDENDHLLRKIKQTIICWHFELFKKKRFNNLETPTYLKTR